MPAPPDTFFRTAWNALREATLADLREGPADPVDALMRRCFEWDVEGACPGPRAEAPRDLVRMYYNLLRENERLPEDEQLSLYDIRLVRETLRGTIAENQNIKALVERLFKLVQAKIESGRITQAWLVLQIFDYERSVRLWNERNLYLEEMTLRFGERKGRSRPSAAPSDLARDDLAAAAAHIEESTGLRLLLLGADAAEREDWAPLFDAGDVPGDDSGPGRRQAIDTLVGRKWRSASAILSADPDELVRGTLSPDAARSQLMAHFKAVYFLLLVSNATGWEPFLPRLYGWLLDATAGASTTLFSDLHRMVTMEECSVREALDQVYSRYARAWVARRLPDLTGQDVAEAARRLVDRIAGSDLSDVPYGSYSLTGMLLDEVLGLEYPSPVLAWHIHRLL